MPTDFSRGIASAKLSLSADERKKQASSEIANNEKTAGRETGRASKHLFKYLNPPTSPRFSCQNVKFQNVKRCAVYKEGFSARYVC